MSLSTYFLLCFLIFVNSQYFILQPQIRGNHGWINTVRISYNQFNPSAAQFVMSSDNTTYIYRYRSNFQVYLNQTLRNLRSIWSLQLSSDIEILVTGGSSNILYVYQRQNGEYVLVGQLTDHQDEVLAIKISTADKKLITGGWDGTPKIYNYNRSEPKRYTLAQNLTTSEDAIRALAIADDSRFVYVGKQNGIMIYQWDQSQKKYVVLQTIDYGGIQRVLSITIGNIVMDGQNHLYVITASSDSFVRIHRYDTSTRKYSDIHQQLYFNEQPVNSVSLSQFNKYLAIGVSDGIVYIFAQQCKDKNCKFISVQNLSDSNLWIRSVRFNRNGTALLAGGLDCVLRLYIWGSCGNGQEIEGSKCVKQSIFWFIGLIVVIAGASIVVIGIIVIVVRKNCYKKDYDKQQTITTEPLLIDKKQINSNQGRQQQRIEPFRQIKKQNLVNNRINQVENNTNSDNQISQSQQPRIQIKQDTGQQIRQQILNQPILKSTQSKNNKKNNIQSRQNQIRTQQISQY